MGEIKPQRIQLRRTKGWNLQEASRALNGLDAVKVDRSTAYGNPFLVNPNMNPGQRQGVNRIFMPTAEEAVDCFRLMLDMPGETADAFRALIPSLRGKNLACWCDAPRPGEPDHCHAAVLLGLANPDPVGG